MLKLYNTLTRKKQIFKPLNEKGVRIYSCGPTVYAKVHVGNLRAFIFDDLLRRYLKFRGFKVMQVMNITDVEDKTIKGSQNEKLPLNEFTEKYTKIFFEDLEKLNIEMVEIYPLATEHIKEIVALIKKLIKSKHAYKAKDGIYFKISSFKKYGKLARLNLKALKAGASGRVRADEYDKRNPQDFVLWKFYTEEDGDVFWKTDIGKGRPGWHIECSAMSVKYLGQPFDIHTGGVDLIFPHHENEIAQTKAATGKKFVNFWMHNEHLLIEGKKMSKSLGNFYTLNDLEEKGYNPLTLRYALLSTHYRQKLNLTFEALDAAREAIKRINDFVLTASLEDNGEIKELVKKSEKEFIKIMDDDLNIAGALGVVFNFIKDANKLGTAGPKAVEFIKKLDSILGILKEQKIPKYVIKLAEERQKARQKKDWESADKLREQIKQKGYEVRDKEDGYILRKI